MKNFIFLAFIIFQIVTFAQENRKITIIDKTEANKAIFDYNDPFSLVSLIKFNDLINPHGILDFKTEFDFSSLPYLEVYNPFSAPLKSMIDFEDSLYIDADGEVFYVYPAPDRIYYDVEGITRIVLIQDSVRHEITGENYFGLSEIAFAKKYGTSPKYDIVLKFDFQDFIKMDAFKVLQKVPNKYLEKLIDLEDSKSALSILKKNCLEAYEKDLKNKHLYSDGPSIPSYISFFNSNRQLFGLRQNEFDSIYTLVAREHAWRNWPWLKDLTYQNLNYNEKEIFLAPFSGRKEIKYEDPKLVPLKSRAWPDEDSIIRDPHTGMWETAYRDNRELMLYWVDFEIIDAHVIWDFHYSYFNGNGEIGSRIIRLEKIIFYVKNPVNENLIAAISIDFGTIDNSYDLNNSLNNNIFNPFRQDFFDDYTQIPWLLKLHSESSRSDYKYDLSNEKDIQLLKREFNLDQYILFNW